MKTFKDWALSMGAILICEIVAVLITSVICLIFGCSWERIFIEIVPPIMMCIMICIALAIILPWPVHEDPNNLAKALIALTAVGVVLLFGIFIYKPMLDARTERYTVGAFNVTAEDGEITIHPATEVMVSRDKDGNIVTIDPEEKFKIRTSDVRIWDTDSFSFDLRKYSDTDYDVVKKSLTLTAETAKKIGLTETDIR